MEFLHTYCVLHAHTDAGRVLSEVHHGLDDLLDSIEEQG